jgi:phosphohistidine phosphatase SixA
MTSPSRPVGGASRRWLPSLTLLLLVGVLAFAAGAATIALRLLPSDFIEVRLLGKPTEAQRLVRHAEWAKKVQGGGYILHFRHAQREKWIDVTAFDVVELRDRVDAELSSFARATCLTPQGIEESKLIANIFRLANVPVTQVISSPLCRARQTAELAFGRVDSFTNALVHLTAIMPSQHAEFSKALRAVMLGVDPKPGQNVVLSGHINTLTYAGVTALDEDQTGGVEARDETGFVVIEKVGGKLIARHRFGSIKDFTHAIVEVPVEDPRPVPRGGRS